MRVGFLGARRPDMAASNVAAASYPIRSQSQGMLESDGAESSHSTSSLSTPIFY